MKLLIFFLLYSLLAYAYAEVYRWVDDNGKTHFSDNKPVENFSSFKKVSLESRKNKIKNFVKLDVPIVSQGASLCGPATIEMIFRYWGIIEYNQYDIAYNILKFKPNIKRVINSKILETDQIKWKKYPGTGTSTMRDFLKQYGITENPKFKALSEASDIAKSQRDKAFKNIKKHLSNGVPVIVHQYWRGVDSSGHYRVVTGYDEDKRLVFLNDANPGVEVTQSYKKFFQLWNVSEPWLHYNAIVFNSQNKKVKVELEKYTSGSS